MPEREQSGVCGEYSAAAAVGCGGFERIGQPAGVVLHAYPPALEGVTLSLGGRHVIELAAYRGGICYLVRALITKIVIDRVFLSVRRVFRPARIERHVGGNGQNSEGVGGGVCAVGKPADERESVAGRIRGLCGHPAVYHGHGIHSIAARGVKGHRVGRLAYEAHL